tara:strand:+ start:602 stop:829 length:228 start_codon:yes stop_codon:yes gene_type:complete
MEIIQLLLFIMIILTLLNGIMFFKKLIKLQEEANVLLRKLLENKGSTDNRSNNPMPSEDLEKLKTSYMAKMKKYD